MWISPGCACEVSCRVRARPSMSDVIDERGMWARPVKWTGFTPRRPQPPEDLGSPPPPEPSLLVECPGAAGWAAFGAVAPGDGAGQTTDRVRAIQGRYRTGRRARDIPDTE